MLFSPHEPRNVPERFVALIPKVCTRAATDTYATQWTDIDVACEACHGPGSRHVAWAEARTGESSGPSQVEPNRRPETGNMGLTTWLASTNHDAWRMNPE